MSYYEDNEEQPGRGPEEVRQALLSVLGMYEHGKESLPVKLLAMMPDTQTLCRDAIGAFKRTLDDIETKDDNDKRALYLDVLSTHLAAVGYGFMEHLKKIGLYDFVFDGLEEESTGDEWKSSPMVKELKEKLSEKARKELPDMSDTDISREVKEFFKTLDL